MIPGLNCFEMNGPEGVRTPDLMTASEFLTKFPATRRNETKHVSRWNTDEYWLKMLFMKFRPVSSFFSRLLPLCYP
jgi:hypothetical protein